jgi:hypothetical protein
MRRTSLLAAACSVLLASAPLGAQDLSNDLIDRFLAGRAAEKPELAKVGTQLDDLDGKIKKFRECFQNLRDAGQVVGGRAAGFAAKALTRAKCGATSEDGLVEDRAKLLAQPEKVGASAAKMDVRQYVHLKEVFSEYLGGSRNFSEGDLKLLAARATDLSNGMGLALVRPASGGNSRSGGVGSGFANALGGAVNARMRMFTPDMTWAYVMYLDGILYMSGATMFESDYKAGEWTKWDINDESQPDQHMVLERAMIRRDADRSEWWRTKTINVSSQSADTIVLETQMKPVDADGLTMQVVRMRGKFPGDSSGKELMVPENMQTVSSGAWTRKPTPESVAGATVGTEPVKVGATTYSAKHVRFGSGGGDMDWWLADKAPGGIVRVQSTANGKESKWTMALTSAGTGAKSELGMK